MISRGALVCVCLMLFFSYPLGDSLSADTSQVWQQSQMREDYMRQITKWNCVEKTRLTLSAGCSKSEQCTMTMAGLLGDCVTYAKGDMRAFCDTYPSWRRQACLRNDLDGRSCAFFEIGERTLCKRGEAN